MEHALLLDEIWRPIDKYPGYFVSSLGNIKSKSTMRKFYRNPAGYYVLCMYLNGKSRTESVHQLVVKAFIPLCPGLTAINHINGVKTDNRVSNLERCSPGQNTKHAYDLGLRKAKLNKVSADIIRDAKNAKFKVSQIAKYFKINRSSVEKVITNRIWV